MSEADPYVLLGVHQEASDDEIRDAYRQLVKRYQPDLHPGDPAAARSFKEIVAAYELLSDPLERARFDRAESGGVDANRADTDRAAPAGARNEGRNGGPGSDAAVQRGSAADPSGLYHEPMVDDTDASDDDPSEFRSREYRLLKSALPDRGLFTVVWLVIAALVFVVTALEISGKPEFAGLSRIPGIDFAIRVMTPDTHPRPDHSPLMTMTYWIGAGFVAMVLRG